MQTDITQKHYRLRASQLATQARKDYGLATLTASQIASWLVEVKKASYSKPTWRQYRASLDFLFNEQLQAGTGNAEDLNAAITVLQQTPPPKGRPKHKKTSAKKAKKIKEADLVRLMDHFAGKPSRHGLAAQAWLLAGLWTGLRPGEWESVQLVEPNQLIVANAKATQGRSHGPTRIIELADLSGQEWEIIRLHLQHVQQAKLNPGKGDKSGFELFFDHCRTCLYEATLAIWPKREQRITLYSARHQFAANAKFNGLPLENIAALMGHASTETAKIHYGRRISGSGHMKVRANSQDVARVTELNQRRVGYGPRGQGM